jgi:hypothetical protein
LGVLATPSMFPSCLSQLNFDLWIGDSLEIRARRVFRNVKLTMVIVAATPSAQQSGSWPVGCQFGLRLFAPVVSRVLFLAGAAL